LCPISYPPERLQDRFTEDELIKTWMIHHLMIIGEAASKITEGTRQRYPDIPWVGTIDVRNIIAHEYFRVNLDIIWRIIAHDLPSLKEQIQEVLGESQSMFLYIFLLPLFKLTLQGVWL
jgi:uncharacterized protein with HEPN domain